MPFPGLARGRGFIQLNDTYKGQNGDSARGRQLHRGGVRRQRSRADTEEGQHSRREEVGPDE